ncbi:MAG: precorrin-6y C5,15-methyltransferase (decarboxylating) subunit CbiE [Alphaproteobacteria bacterium]|nr:MAG: precorrin-6y C5,15-methyltransferase (decarboxylating) subunit CbiE [Alphaproteobacteria bacterium]
MTAPAPWLAVVGVGEDGLTGLSATARALVEGAEILIGGARHLAMVPEDGRPRRVWPSPLDALVREIVALRGRRVCVLATGDPMHYGIGVTLARHIPIDEMVIVPAPSAFSLACARLGWSMGTVETLSLHGRPIELLHAVIEPGARVIALSHDRTTPGRIAALLSACDYGDSRLVVLQHMGGAAERRLEGTAAAWDIDAASIADFNTVAIECVAAPDARVPARGPGLPDTAFRHDGQLTKREVRAVTLAALAPVAGELLWDVGAGCGSVAIEWLRARARTRAVAIERDGERAALIAANAASLGTPHLAIVPGTAPAALAGLEAPDAVFIGGGTSQPGLIEACWEALRPGGRLVANAVTVEGERALFAWHAAHGGDLVRVAVARAGPVGSFSAWRALRPVTQLCVRKPMGATS